MTRLAHSLALLALLGAIALPVLSILIWVFWDSLSPLVTAQLMHQLDVSALSVMDKIICAAISLVGAGLGTFGLLKVRRTFQEAAVGRPLSQASVLGFKHFAWISVLLVPVGVLQKTGYIVVFSLADPAHDGMLSIQFGSLELKALFTALVFLFVAHVFAAGQRAEEENALIV